jgi:hypothetical protein
MAEKPWYEGLDYGRYKGFKLFRWNGEKFLGSGIKYLTNRYQVGHAKKDTEFDPKAIAAFNLKIELYAQQQFNELVELGHKVTYSDVFPGNKLSDDERARRDRDAKKRADERAQRKAESEKKRKEIEAGVAQRKKDRLKKLEQKHADEAKKIAEMKKASS